jgi:hypothetical protein
VAEGVFQTDREIFNNPVWKNVLKFRLFFYIYGNAVYMESGKDYSGVHVNRGQFLKSYRKLQECLEYIENHAIKQYSLSQIKRAIDELEEEGRITKKETELGTLFTVCNYEEYQGFERFTNDSIEQRKNSVRTALEQMKNNNKKDNKDNKEKNIKDIVDKPHTQKFIPPSLDEIKSYCKERNNKVDAERFFDFYSSKGWMVGKNKMKDWKAAVRTWEKDKQITATQTQRYKAPQTSNFEQRQRNSDYFDKFIKTADKQRDI